MLIIASTNLTAEINVFDLCVRAYILREEGEATIKGLRATLDEEQAVERDRLEARRRQDLENLKAELEAETQAERRRLLAEKEEKLSSLRQEVNDCPFHYYCIFPS